MQRQSDIQISNSVWVIDYWKNAHAPKAWHFQSHLHFISQAGMVLLPLPLNRDLLAGGFGRRLVFLGSVIDSLSCLTVPWKQESLLCFLSTVWTCHQQCALFSQTNVEHVFRDFSKSRSCRWSKYGVAFLFSVIRVLQCLQLPEKA